MISSTYSDLDYKCVIPRSISDPVLTGSLKSFKKQSSERSFIFTQDAADLVNSYARLRCGDKSVTIFEHNETITIIAFRDDIDWYIFAKGKVVGKGQEGTVYLAQDLASKYTKLLVVKIRECYTRGSKLDCLNEYKILQYLSYARGFLKYDHSYYMFMEYFRGFTVSSIPHSWPDTLKQAVASGLLRALHRIHSVGILHGDVKPNNFIVEYQNGWIVVKLIDFGQAVFKENSNNLMSGAPAYQPPESRSFNPPIRSEKTEYYSLAICQLDLLSQYSFQVYQDKKFQLDPYLHEDLIKCCHDVFFTQEALADILTPKPWYYEILRNAYHMYQKDIKDRADVENIVQSIALQDELESCHIKAVFRSQDSGKILPTRKTKTIRKLNLSEVYSASYQRDGSERQPYSPSKSSSPSSGDGSNEQSEATTPNTSPKDATFAQKVLRMNSIGNYKRDII